MLIGSFSSVQSLSRVRLFATPWVPRPPCLSPTPWVYSNSCLLSRWCHPAISYSVIPFSSCPQSFPASGSFQMSQLFSSSGQSIGVSASTSVLPMNISIITLNINRLNAPTKRHRLAGWMKTCACMHFHLPYHSAWPLKLHVIIFIFCLAIVKTDKHLLLLWLCNYYSFHTIVSWLVNRKIIEFYITKTTI